MFLYLSEPTCKSVGSQLPVAQSNPQVISGCCHILIPFTLKKKNNENYLLFIYLAAPDLSCSMFDLLAVAYGIQLFNQGWNSGPLHWEHRVLTHWPTREVPTLFVKIDQHRSPCTKASLQPTDSLCPSDVLHLVTQSCPTLSTPWTASLQVPVTLGILQTRTLEWGACPFYRGSSQPRDRTQVSRTACRFFTSWRSPCPSDSLD